MFLDFLITAIAGGIVFVEDVKKSQTTDYNRSVAREKKEPIYWDGNNKRRSTETNEIVCWENHTGHTQYVGVKTGRVYRDESQEKLDELNYELYKQGKKFMWMEYPQWKLGNGHRERMHYDFEKGLPYIVKRFSHGYPLISKEKDDFYIYYITDMNTTVPTPDYNTGRKLSHEEEDYYITIDDRFMKSI